jgi:exopolyphosphatase/guanosine-5'-triphosphate,3'-diphosphate pyrophosphatase
MKATIDIGSNTILMLVGDVQDDRLIEIEDHARITGLGRDLDKNGEFLELAMEESFAALSDYKEIALKNSIGPEKVIVTATEASRVAKNASVFYARVEAVLGFKVRIISAVEEANLTAMGICLYAGSVLPPDIVLMDIGGASTELIKIKTSPFEIVSSISLAVGSVRATDWVNGGHFEEKLKNLLSLPELMNYQTEHLICVAGSMTAIGGMFKGLSIFRPDEVNGTRFNLKQFSTFIDGLRELDVVGLSEKFPFLGKRATTVVAGAQVGLAIGEILGVKSFEISTRGLRHGSLFAQS